MPQQPDRRGPVVFLVLLAIVGLIVVAWGAGRTDAKGAVDPARPHRTGAGAAVEPVETPAATRRGEPGRPVPLPDGGTRVFGGQPLRHVYELIVTIADGSPGTDGDYSHDVPRAVVQTYLDAAHRHHALLLLDLQPGRSTFPEVAKRWAWALRDPWVGLALDPEWRMGPHQVPAHTIGQVGAPEVNRTSHWLAGLTRSAGLPQKLFVVHQFRVDMVQHLDDVVRRRGLATVQHVDGFGTRKQKLATYHAVARPQRFTMGLKLFYDEDVDRMGPVPVHALRPPVRFVSFQ